ncbi:MAG: NUDIX domain-containing protein [Ruminococcaceae bacterium]|nr:NUDIX domain-containing protein [Oscillospiraceae bacterium]
MELLRKIEQYRPWNEQEARDREALLLRLRRGEALFTRENTQAHWTASAWVTDPKREQVLMAYHKLYDSWAWLGGHADGETDLLAVAIREVREESGLERVRPVTEEIYSLEILSVSGHEKKGMYVPPHLHLNLTFLLEADPAAPLRAKEDENSAVAWFAPEEAVAASTEPWIRENIYAKLNAKLRDFKKKTEEQ